MCRVRVWLRALVLALSLAVFPLPALAQRAIEYTVSIPAPEQRWLQVEARFPARRGRPLDVRMARSSPGRYASHEFGKNVYRLEAIDAAGKALPMEALAPDHWRITPSGAQVRVRYRLFGDRVDGTYAAIDGTHAHLNAPATFLWAPSLRDTTLRVRFEQPPGRTWSVATQLFPTGDPLVYTAPNLQYLMDSPVEFSAFVMREFSVERPGGTPARIRLAVHHLGTDAEVEALTRDVEAIVREQAAIYGALPVFDTGTYTFLMDYLPWAEGDGMEHRNSTVCSSGRSLAAHRVALAGTASHEFFHAWNVERIRPASLEPFDYTAPNMSGELWLAEGFTTYYGSLVMARAGLVPRAQAIATLGQAVDAAVRSPGTQFRSAVDMSRLAPYVDAAVSIDPTNWENTFVSYYTYGAAIGLGLDLTLRTRTSGALSLDDYMRALWTRYGARAGKAPGYVARPYTLHDLQHTLATLTGDAAFARDFFARHITGLEPIPYRRLLEAVGYDLREQESPSSLGTVRLEMQRGRVVVANNTVSTDPVYQAGLGRDDAVVSLGGRAITAPADWDAILHTLSPGTAVPLVFESRGQTRTATAVVERNRHLEIVPRADITARQRELREAWLAARRR